MTMNTDIKMLILCPAWMFCNHQWQRPWYFFLFYFWVVILHLLLLLFVQRGLQEQVNLLQ